MENNKPLIRDIVIVSIGCACTIIGIFINEYYHKQSAQNERQELYKKALFDRKIEAYSKLFEILTDFPKIVAKDEFPNNKHEFNLNRIKMYDFLQKNMVLIPPEIIQTAFDYWADLSKLNKKESIYKRTADCEFILTSMCRYDLGIDSIEKITTVKNERNKNLMKLYMQLYELKDAPSNGTGWVSLPENK